MKPSALKPATPWLLAAGLLVLLLILGSLQYRWLDAVSRADLENTREVLETAAERVAADFDRELTRAFLVLHPGFQNVSGERYAERVARWHDYAPFPELVRAVLVARPGGDGQLELARFVAESGRFDPAPWPAELDGLRRHLGDLAPGPGERSESFRFPRPFLADGVPALILPAIGAPPDEPRWRGRPRRRNGPRREPTPPRGPASVVVIWLDLETLTGVILPRLVDQHLQTGDGTRYRARVVAAQDAREIFRQGEVPAGDGDASAPLFALLPPGELGTLAADAGGPWRPDPAGGGEAGARRGPARGEQGWILRSYGRLSRESGARWRLQVSHPAGSLDAAVARARRSNLALGFGILLLLAASVGLMLISTRRLQAAARQQLDFVAGVTHELLTPLAAMRSAGQNLADGVVEGPEQVRRYGRLIDDEGRRQTGMVRQVLELAGLLSGSRAYALRRTAVPEVIASALDEIRPLLEEQGIEVEARIDGDLPQVMADAAALGRAVQNLIGNAAKYGAEGSWVGVGARCDETPRGTELSIAVEDRGPGIAAADLPHLFEPFYRGWDGSRQVPGSGLGLSLVKHVAEGHGGRVEVDTVPGEGSTFTLRLPAAGNPPREGAERA